MPKGNKMVRQKGVVFITFRGENVSAYSEIFQPNAPDSKWKNVSNFRKFFIKIVFFISAILKSFLKEEAVIVVLIVRLRFKTMVTFSSP